MEFINSVSRVKLAIILLISVFTFQVRAQSPDAFKASYQAEAKREYSKAIDVLKAVYDEKSYEINLRLGWLNYLANAHNESISYYKKAMDLKPYAVEPCLGFAMPASILGKWNEILQVYTKILNIDPNNSLVNYRKGLILYNRGDFQGAEVCFEKVVNLYPFDYDGLHMLAWTKLKLQKTGEAKILFQKALCNRPDNPSDKEGLSLIK